MLGQLLGRNRGPRPVLSREEREAKQQQYLIRAAMLGLPALAGAGYVLYLFAWWLPLAFAGACASLVIARMLYKPRPLRLDLRR